MAIFLCYAVSLQKLYFENSNLFGNDINACL